MKKAFSLILILAVAALLYAALTFDSRIRQHLEDTLSHLTGVAVVVKSVELSLFDAKGEIRGLTVKNPKGYSDGDAVVMDAIHFSIDRSTLFEQPLVLNSLVFDSPVINLELKEDFQSNLEDIVEVSNKQLGIKNKKKKKKKAGNKNQNDQSGQEENNQANAESPESEESAEETAEEGSPGKDDSYQMLIRKIRVDNLTLNAEYDGKQWTEIIEEMEIKGIGKKQSVSTRAIGIMMLRKLANKATREVVKKKAGEVTQEEIEELGSKLLESLLKKD